VRVDDLAEEFQVLRAHRQGEVEKTHQLLLAPPRAQGPLDFLQTDVKDRQPDGRPADHDGLAHAAQQLQLRLAQREAGVEIVGGHQRLERGAMVSHRLPGQDLVEHAMLQVLHEFLLRGNRKHEVLGRVPVDLARFQRLQEREQVGLAERTEQGLDRHRGQETAALSRCVREARDRQRVVWARLVAEAVPVAEPGKTLHRQNAPAQLVDVGAVNAAVDGGHAQLLQGNAPHAPRELVQDVGGGQGHQSRPRFNSRQKPPATL